MLCKINFFAMLMNLQERSEKKEIWTFLLRRGSGGPPPEKFENLGVKWCILSHSEPKLWEIHE